jgi:hypothetical protein
MTISQETCLFFDTIAYVDRSVLSMETLKKRFNLTYITLLLLYGRIFLWGI